MNFVIDPELMLLKKSVIEFAANELNKDAIAREKRGEFYWEGWRKCAQYGIQALPIPKEFGGQGKDIISLLLTMEGLGYACKDSGLLFTLATHILTCEIPILDFGSEFQKEKYLPRMAKGELIGGHAITEPQSGSDAFSLETSATKKGDIYILNGNKMFITNAPIADLLIIFARTGTGKGFADLTAFLVEKSFPGFSVGKPLEKLGLRTSPMSEVVLTDCLVPEANRLGREGQGAFIFNSEMEWERSCLFACHLGTMEFLLELCINHAKTRRQFGVSIGEFDAILEKIADMKIRLELSRLMLYKIAWMKSQGYRAPLESAIAKLYISESFVKSSLEAIQIFGGYGYLTDQGIERYLRDAVAGTIYSGTSEILRKTIASWLGL